MNPVVVLDLLAGLGGTVDRVLVVGCEPASLDEGIGLSAPVERRGRPRRRRHRGPARRPVRADRAHGCKGDLPMIRKLFVLSALAAVAGLVIPLAARHPRYLKIREM